MEQSNNLESQVDILRKKLEVIRMENQNQTLVGTSVVQDLQTNLEKIKSNVKVAESENTHRANKKKDISRELTQIIQSVRNLYTRCYNNMRVKPVFNGPKENIVIDDILNFELDVILMKMSDLVEISADYKLYLGGGDKHMSSSLSVNTNELQEKSVTTHSNSVNTSKG